MLGDGYPERSAILVVGPPSIGKEAAGCWFIRSGLIQGDYCLYATHRPVSDILRDMKGLGVGVDRVPDWIAHLRLAGEVRPRGYRRHLI